MWTKQSCQSTFSLHIFYGFLPGHKKWMTQILMQRRRRAMDVSCRYVSQQRAPIYPALDNSSFYQQHSRILLHGFSNQIQGAPSYSEKKGHIGPWQDGETKFLNTVLSYAHFTGLLDVFARFLFEIQILELGHRVTLSTYKR